MRIPMMLRILVFTSVLTVTASATIAQRRTAPVPTLQSSSSEPESTRNRGNGRRSTISLVSQSNVSPIDESYFEPPLTPAELLNSNSECCTPQCQPPCCFNYCCDPSRLWTFRVGAMFLHRQRPADQPLISDPAIAGSGLNARDFNPGWGSGIDASLIRHRLFGSNNDLELRYFGINNWTSSQSLQLNGDPLTIHTNPPTSITGGRNINSQYSSSLLNTELNLRHRAGDRVTLLAGFRYLQFNEQLNTQLLTGTGFDDINYNVAATNDLFGLQAGALYDLFSSCDCCVQLYGKAGLYANQSAQYTSMACNCAPPATFSANGQSTRLATVGEFGITGSRRIWRNLALRGGYQMIGLSGVTTAPGQFPATDFLNQSGLSNNNSVLFHGATVGLEWTY